VSWRSERGSGPGRVRSAPAHLQLTAFGLGSSARAVDLAALRAALGYAVFPSLPFGAAATAIRSACLCTTASCVPATSTVAPEQSQNGCRGAHASCGLVRVAQTLATTSARTASRYRQSHRPLGRRARRYAAGRILVLRGSWLHGRARRVDADRRPYRVASAERLGELARLSVHLRRRGGRAPANVLLAARPHSCEVCSWQSGDAAGRRNGAAEMTASACLADTGESRLVQS